MYYLLLYLFPLCTGFFCFNRSTSDTTKSVLDYYTDRERKKLVLFYIIGLIMIIVLSHFYNNRYASIEQLHWISSIPKSLIYGFVGIQLIRYKEIKIVDEKDLNGKNRNKIYPIINLLIIPFVFMLKVAYMRLPQFLLTIIIIAIGNFLYSFFKNKNAVSYKKYFSVLLGISLLYISYKTMYDFLVAYNII